MSRFLSPLWRAARPYAPDLRLLAELAHPVIAAAVVVLPDLPLEDDDIAPKPPRRWRRKVMLPAAVALVIVLLVGMMRLWLQSSAFPFVPFIPPQAQGVVAHVPIQTQLDPTLGYDSPAQYAQFSDVSCSAASASSVLLAWGDTHARIGQVIDEMAPDLTTAGLQDLGGFRRVAQAEGFSATISQNISSGEIAELVSVEHIPVIVALRATTKHYYPALAPGHFLVIVGADPNGFRTVDNSTYFIHYLPTNVFMALWDHQWTIILTPPGYPLPLPA